LYRHAHALGLFQKRQRNVRAALNRIIERAESVDVTASAVVAAIQAYAKINSAGEWIDKTETVSLNNLFGWMSTQELEAYAQTGALPGWFKGTGGATEGDSQKRLIVDIYMPTGAARRTPGRKQASICPPIASWWRNCTA
jgi:hypothetical protein